ncbi:acid-sensing ion channel 2-like [Clytia hemisphaerica]|uniref:acid-sensing ion channel 2-like n=1 Tax=Clytia hemisphaerica TaxID=252671 RepID=UPI0034D668EB
MVHYRWLVRKFRGWRSMSSYNCNEKEMESQKVEKTENVGNDKEELFNTFYNSVTLHGFKFLFEKSSMLRKGVWFLIIMVAFMCSIALFFDLVGDFLERKTNIDTIEYYEENHEFPTLTICPYDSQSKQKLNNLTVNYTKADFLDLVQRISQPTSENLSLTPEIQNFLKELDTRNVKNYMDLLSMYNMDFKDLIDNRVYLNNETCQYYSKYCSKQDFETVIWNNHQTCIEFNSFISGKPSLVVGKIDNRFRGFQLYLDLGQTSYFRTADLHGVMVMINKFGNAHHLLPDKSYVSVKPGEMAFIKLKEYESSLLPPPYHSNCGTREYHLINKKRPYTNTLCKFDCITNHVYQKCGCVGDEMKHIKKRSVKLCKLEKMICYNYYKALFMEKKYKDCFNQCPQECTQTTYKVKKATVRIGSDEVYKNIQRTVPSKANMTLTEIKEYFRENIVGIHVSFFDNIIIKEKMIPSVRWTCLIASVGGGVGLGLGFSFITAFEFVFFIYDYIKLSLRRVMSSRKDKRDVIQVVKMNMNAD